MGVAAVDLDHGALTANKHELVAGGGGARPTSRDEQLKRGQRHTIDKKIHYSPRGHNLVATWQLSKP